MLLNFSINPSKQKLTGTQIYLFLLAIVFYLQSSIATAACIADRQTQTRSFGINLTENALSIAADAPIGTIIYNDTINTYPTKVTCGSGGINKGFHINSDLVSWGSNDYTFALENTGLSFKIIGRQSNGAEFPEQRPRHLSVYHEDYTMTSTYRIAIYKSAALSTQKSVPAGLLGSIKWDNFEYLKLYLANPITLNTASCQTPEVSVQMGGDYRLEEFNKTGDTPRMIKFNIGLNQCQSGINKVTYSLKATTQVIDSQKGIVALNSSSTAKGIGLKLMNEAGQPIALDTAYPLNEFNTTGTSFNIPLSAAYYRLADSRLEAGTANTEVTFIVNYL